MVTLPHKTIILQGSLKESVFYHPYPSDELSRKKISVLTVFFESQEDIDEFCVITCNFITSEKFQNFRLLSYEQPLGTFRLKTDASKRKSFQNIQTIGLIVNSPSERLKFNFTKLDGKPITANCKINLLVSFT